MSEPRQYYDDEIDLFEIFEMLWSEKALISAFVVISVLFAVGFLATKDNVYESRLVYTVDTVPPFYEDDKALSDFQKRFYSKDAFADWKKANKDSQITFEDFEITEILDGYVLAKDEDEQFAISMQEKTTGPFILVRTYQLSLLNDIFSYANHINALLKLEYVLRAKEELNIIETRFKDFSTANDAIISQLLAVDRYIFAAKKGANVLLIKHPTMPEKVSPRPSLILALSVVLGGMIGAIFILVRSAIRKRKKQLTKA